MREQDFGPLAQLVLALVEIVALVEAACPLDDVVVLKLLTDGGLVEFVLPAWLMTMQG